MKRLLFLFMLLVLLTACSSAKDERVYEREEDLMAYLEMKKIDMRQDSVSYLLVSQDGFCGACTDEVLYFTKLFFQENDSLAKKYWVATGKKTGLINRELKQVHNASFLLDEKGLYIKYGLQYTRDLVFKFRAGKLVYWARLSPDLDKLKKVGEQLKEK